MPQTTAILEGGKELAGFRIESLLAEGGMGTVYLATQLRLDREVALKVLSAERNEDPEFQERFVRESKLAASLDHPNVLPIYDAGEADGVIYLAMRYVEGGDLRRLLREHGRIGALLALDITRQVALALDAAHKAGLVHRDVKPANILLGTEGHAYLADFGLARRVNTGSLTQTGVFMGTPDYAAPEQLEGIRAVDGRADVYSLGCVLYWCLAGQPPYVRESEVGVITAHFHDPIPQLSHVRPDLPAELSGIVAKTMEKNPADRYASASALATALGGVLAELGGARAEAMPVNPTSAAPPANPRPGRTKTILDRIDAQTPVPLPTEDDKRGVRRRVLIGVAAFVVLVGAVLGGLLISSSGTPAAQLVQSISKPLALSGFRASASRSHGGQAILEFVPHPSKLKPVRWLQLLEESRSAPPGKPKRLAKTTSPLLIGGLKNGHRYQLRLRACNTKGCGDWSGWASATPFGKPPAPKVSASRKGPYVVFSWRSSGTNGKPIARYLITLTINGHKTHVIRTKSGQITVLVHYSGHGSIQAQAVDSTGWASDKSRSQTATGAAPAHVTPTVPNYTVPNYPVPIPRRTHTVPKRTTTQSTTIVH